MPPLGAAPLGGAAAGGVGLPAEEGSSTSSVRQSIGTGAAPAAADSASEAVDVRNVLAEVRNAEPYEAAEVVKVAAEVRNAAGSSGSRSATVGRGGGWWACERRSCRWSSSTRAALSSRLRQRRDLALRLEHRTLEAVILLLEDRDLRLERLLRRLRHLDRLELLAEPFGLVVAAARL